MKGFLGFLRARVRLGIFFHVDATISVLAGEKLYYMEKAWYFRHGHGRIDRVSFKSRVLTPCAASRGPRRETRLWHHRALENARHVAGRQSTVCERTSP